MLFATLVPTIAYADTYIGGPYPSATQAAFAICGYSWDDYSHEGNSGVAEDMMQSSAGGPYSAFARFANTMHYDALDHSVWWSSAEGMLYATMKDAAKADIERSIAAHTTQQESGITHGDGDDSGVTGGDDGQYYEFSANTAYYQYKQSTLYEWLATDSTLSGARYTNNNYFCNGNPRDDGTYTLMGPTITLRLAKELVPSDFVLGNGSVAYLQIRSGRPTNLKLYNGAGCVYVTNTVINTEQYPDKLTFTPGDTTGYDYTLYAGDYWTYDGGTLTINADDTLQARAYNPSNSQIVTADTEHIMLYTGTSGTGGGGGDTPTEPDPTPTTPTAPDPPDEPQPYTPTLPTPTYPTTTTVNVTTNMYDWSPYFEDILWYLNDIDALLYNLYDVLESHCVHLQQRMHDESLYIGAYLQYVSDTLDATLRGIDSRLAQIAPYPQLMHGQLEQLLGFAYDMWMDLDTVAAELTNIQHPNADTPTDYGVLLQILQAINGLDVGGTTLAVDLTDIQDTLDAILLDFEQYCLDLYDKLDEILAAMEDDPSVSPTPDPWHYPVRGYDEDDNPIGWLVPRGPDAIMPTDDVVDPTTTLNIENTFHIDGATEAGQMLMTKFPFTMLPKLVEIMGYITANPQAPQFDLPVPNPADWEHPTTVHVDLSMFDVVAAVGRMGLMVWWVSKFANRTVQTWVRAD